MIKRACVRGVASRVPLFRVSRAAAFGLLVASLGSTGIASPAEAASFYTRKRVNGVWVTGQFPKDGRAASVRRVRPPRAAAVAAATTMPPLPPIPDEAGVARPVAADSDGPVSTSSLPFPAASPDAADSPPLDERLARLKDALQARAGELVAKVGLSPAPDPVPAPVPELRTLAEASSAAGPARGLSFVAPAAASTALPLRLPLPETAPVPAAPVPAGRPALPALEPRSVSYDFETGIKTTTYASSVVREPFDVTAMKGLAVRAPAR